MTKIKKIKGKLGPRTMKKNPFLKNNGGLDLIEKFPEYGSRRKREKRR